MCAGNCPRCRNPKNNMNSNIILFAALVRLCGPLGLQADLYSDFEESGAVPSAPSAVVGGYAVFVEGDGAYFEKDPCGNARCVIASTQCTL